MKRVAFPPAKKQNISEGASSCSFSKRPSPIATTRIISASTTPTYKDPELLILPNKHDLSLEIASQLHSVLNNASIFLAGVDFISGRKVAEGLVEVTIKVNHGLYACQSWPIQIGGMGSFIDQYAFDFPCDLDRSPIAVRFAVPIAHTNVDDSGFVTTDFWTPFLAINSPITLSLQSLISRIVTMLHGPFSSPLIDNSDYLNAEAQRCWESAAKLTYTKVYTIQAYERIAKHNSLIQGAYSPAIVNFMKNSSIWFTKEFNDTYIASLVNPDSYDSIWRNYCSEMSPGIFAFDFFSPLLCNMLINEVDTYEGSNLPRRRPNTMNKYGLIVNEIGLHQFMTFLLDTYIRPLACIFYASEVVVKGLDHHHSFVVEYAAEDKDVGLVSTYTCVFYYFFL